MKQFKTVDREWRIQETTRLFGLTLTETGTITAPPGKQVTLVYNGENLPLVPGQYEGDVVLEVTDVLKYQGLDFRAAVVLEDGKYVPEKSVQAAAVGGEIRENLVSGVTFVSREEAVNGIFVSIPQGTETVIENVKLDLSGNGGSDFAGWGAAISGCGKGKLTVNNADITTHGAARVAIYAGDEVALEVNDSVIRTRGGVLNADYTDTIKTTPPGVMRRVPWMLGLRGNCRATNLLDYATATYNRCDISADGWGVMSTDGVKRCRMQINDSNIEITGSSGYGTLSIGDCVVDFKNSFVKAGDYGMVALMGKGSGSFRDGTVVNAGRFATMSSMNQGLIAVSDATLNSGESTFLVKGCGTEFQVDRARLNPGNGILLQVMDNDDPGNPTGYFMEPEAPDVPLEGRDLFSATPGTDVVASFSNMSMTGDILNGSSNRKADTGGPNLMAGGPPAGMPPMGEMPVGGPPAGMPPMGEMPAGGPPAGMPPMGEMPAGGPPEGMPPMGEMSGPPAGFSMPDLSGPAVKNLSVALRNVTFTGRISATVSKHRVPRISKENCEELGEVENTLAPVVNNGVIVMLDGSSTWTVTGDCYLSSLTIAPGAVIRAENGCPTLTVDGTPTALGPGTYTGDLRLTL